MGEKLRVAAKASEAKKETKVSQKQKTERSQSTSSPYEQILFLQRTIGNQAVGRLIRSGALKAKLRIGKPGDIYEQEADRVAEQVMRMPGPNRPKYSDFIEGKTVKEDENSLNSKEIFGSTPTPTKTKDATKIVPKATVEKATVASQPSEAESIQEGHNVSPESAPPKTTLVGVQAEQKIAGKELSSQVKEMESASEKSVANVEARADEIRAAEIVPTEPAVTRIEAEPLPPLIEFLGTIEEEPSGGLMEESKETPISVSKPNIDSGLPIEMGSEANSESEFKAEPTVGFIPIKKTIASVEGAHFQEKYNPEVARAEVKSIADSIGVSSAAIQQRIEVQAEDVREKLVSNADALSKSIQAQVASNVASLHATFTAERASVEASLKVARSQVAASLKARKAEAVESGEAAKASVTDMFKQHRTNIETTVQDNITASEKMRSHYANEVHERIQSQASEADRCGQVKATSYPDTERGRLQANAALGVANRTSQEMRQREPEAIEAIQEITAEIPEKFQEQGQKALEGFDKGLPELFKSIDEQVRAITNALNEQANQAYQQLEALGAQIRQQLSALEKVAVGRAKTIVPQSKAQIDSGVKNALAQIDTAAPLAIGQVSKIGEEAAQVLFGIETPEVEGSQEFTNQILAFMAGIADNAGSGLQKASDGMGDEFQKADAATTDSLQSIEQKVVDELQILQDTSNTALSDFVEGIDNGFGDAILALEESFTEMESQVGENLNPIVQELAEGFSQTLQDAEAEIVRAVGEGLAKNDEALSQLDAQMQEAANDAAWDYDHPVLATLRDIGSFILGAIVGILAIIALIVVVIVAFKLIIAGLVAIGVSALVAKIIVVVLGLGLLAYGIYEAYQARVKAGEAGGWRTFGMALLDFTGITDIYRAFTAPGLSPFERGFMFGEGLVKLVTTILLVRGAWRFVRSGGLRAAWNGLWRGAGRLIRSIGRGIRGAGKWIRRRLDRGRRPKKLPSAKPVISVKRPQDRHFIKKVTQSSVAKDKNTVIEPWVDVSADVEGINAGRATPGMTLDGVKTYTINGRTYGVEPNGRLFPIKGNGFIELDRGAYKALGVYNKFGTSSEAETILDKMGINTEQRELAKKAWEAGKK